MKTTTPNFNKDNITLNAYIVSESEQSIGPQGSILLRKPTRIEEFPNSSCLDKIWLYQDPETDFCSLKVFFTQKPRKTSRKKSGANNFRVYEYTQGQSQEMLNILEELVKARDSLKGSVGKVYNLHLKNNPSIGRSYAVA